MDIKSFSVGSKVFEWLKWSLLAIVILKFFNSISDLIGCLGGILNNFLLVLSFSFPFDIWYSFYTFVLMCSELFMVDQLRRALLRFGRVSHLAATVYMTVIAMMCFMNLLSGHERVSESIFYSSTPSQWELFSRNFQLVSSNVLILIQFVLGVWLSLTCVSKVRIYGFVLFLMPLVASLFSFLLNTVVVHSLVSSSFIVDLNHIVTLLIFIVEVLPWVFLLRCFSPNKIS